MNAFIRATTVGSRTPWRHRTGRLAWTHPRRQCGHRQVPCDAAANLHPFL